jgi:hypothetical protein
MTDKKYFYSLTYITRTNHITCILIVQIVLTIVIRLIVVNQGGSLVYTMVVTMQLLFHTEK